MDTGIVLHGEYVELQQVLKSASRRRLASFVSVIVFVAAISAYDGYLVVRTGDVILDYEMNPVGRYLITYNDADASLFLRLKAAGTLIALTSLSLLWRQAPRLANPVAVVLVLFQAGLLVILEMPAH